MADFYHPALRGEQIHESKIKVLPTGSSMPVPEWEGQLIAIGLKLYWSRMESGALIWTEPQSSTISSLPANVVIFEAGFENPPSPHTGSGRIYTNSETKDCWYLSGGQWIKLGTGSSSNFEIISGRSLEDWQGNYFGLLNPSDPLQDNCLFIKKWQPATKYYLAIQTPTMLSLGGSDDNLFYLELWEILQKSLISTYGEAIPGIIVIDTSFFPSPSNPYRLGMYIMRNATKIYLNFRFNLDTRLIQIQGIANISFGY